MWRKYMTMCVVNCPGIFVQRRILRPEVLLAVSRRYNSRDAAGSSAQALKSIILDKIKLNGPVTVADYMKLASSVYYSMLDVSNAESGAPTGIGSDFATSPEISQMFGELIGVWCAYETWKIGHRGPWQVVEMGPGNGSLMYDFLNTLRELRLISENSDHRLTLQLVEISDVLATKQERLLCAAGSSSADGEILRNASVGDRDTSKPEYDTHAHFKRNVTKFGPSVFWYKDLDDVPRHFSVILAHEFFDALPIHKFQRDNNGKWREVYIDADLDRRQLKFALAPCESFAQRTYLTKDVLELIPPGVNHVEFSPRSVYLLQQMINRITEDGGVILIIDYGYDGVSTGDTLRAFRKHRVISNFLDEDPGSCDITADVNFGYMKKWAEDKACCFGPITQGEFLKNLGIEVRLARLLEKAKSDQERNYLRNSYDLLVNDDQMGAKFKVLALFPKVLKPYLALRQPAGFSLS